MAIARIETVQPEPPPRKMALELVWVAMDVINPEEYQEPSIVYRRKEDALKDGWAEEDLREVIFIA